MSAGSTRGTAPEVCHRHDSLELGLFHLGDAHRRYLGAGCGDSVAHRGDSTLPPECTLITTAKPMLGTSLPLDVERDCHSNDTVRASGRRCAVTPSSPAEWLDSKEQHVLNVLFTHHPRHRTDGIIRVPLSTELTNERAGLPEDSWIRVPAQ